MKKVFLEISKNSQENACARVPFLKFHVCNINIIFRGGSRAARTFKMEWFVITVNGWKPLTIMVKHSILDVAAALDPPLILRQRVMMIIFDETQIDTGYP